MSMTTPAGWFPDPNTPGTERWWDGTAWTAHTRPVQAQVPVPAQVPPAGFGPPTVPMAPASSGGGGRGRPLALAAAGVVLAGAVAVGAVLLGNDDTSDPVAAPDVSEPAATTADPKNSQSATPPATDDSGTLTDQLNGITIPVPEGWEKSDSSLDEGATMATDETYDCPAGGSPLCRRGRVSSITATRTDKNSPQALAEQDIAKAADKAYEEDAVGARIYGGIRSHTVLRSQSVAVAGRAGYVVRWRVVTGAGPGGYVQSLVFPSSVGSESMVIVRFAFDASPKAPKLADMDKIAAGIRPIGDATSGGVGSSIGPG
ncbi:uncharacterized protein DUF2510 [Streptomyces sp. SLBN-118]|uniref:DUF2510 domain-containing protein n=1 Tax=Streptomyces sp. SLBN-118 TaxID=2768454 RepID=UPI00114FB410|nr:DUF2510 domain-containing protein [Streptomyces sp. SLBN-118]TQK43441.1 uncharacterized protein DUF2510 [Streptomyces sp. SLBN-118]